MASETIEWMAVMAVGITLAVLVVMACIYLDDWWRGL